MEAQCSTIIADTGKISSVVDDATRAQDRLYASYNKVRLASSVPVAAAAASAKDLVRGLAAK